MFATDDDGCTGRSEVIASRRTNSENQSRKGIIHAPSGGGCSTNPEVLVLVIVLVVGELLNGAAPAGEAAEGAAGEAIEAVGMEEESRERGWRRAAGCVGKRDEEDAQTAAQAAAHATLCLLALLRRRHSRVGAQGGDAAGVGEGEGVTPGGGLVLALEIWAERSVLSRGLWGLCMSKWAIQLSWACWTKIIIECYHSSILHH